MAAHKGGANLDCLKNETGEIGEGYTRVIHQIKNNLIMIDYQR